MVSQSSQSNSFYIFIGLSSVIVIVCIVAWFLLRFPRAPPHADSLPASPARYRRHPYGQVYLSNCGSVDERRRSQSAAPLQSKSAADDAADALPSETTGDEHGDAAAAADDDQSGMLLRGANQASSRVTDVDDGDVGNSSLPVKQRLRLILQLLRGPLLSSAVAVAGNFGITLALFPGVLTEMRSSNRSLDDW